MAEFRFGNSTCQVEGEIVALVDVALGPGEGVYFEHHAMLRKTSGPASWVRRLGPWGLPKDLRSDACASRATG